FGPPGGGLLPPPPPPLPPQEASMSKDAAIANRRAVFMEKLLVIVDCATTLLNSGNGGETGGKPHADFALQRRTVSSSVVRGSAPCRSTSSWNPRRSNADPIAFFASARSRE